jgi:hypothetical protein
VLLDAVDHLRELRFDLGERQGASTIGWTLRFVDC